MTEQPDWTEQARRLITGLSGMFAGQSPMPTSSEPAGADCRWCPLCQAAAVLRGERPELTTAMSDVLATAAAALRSLAGQAEAAPGTPPAESAAAGPAGQADPTPDDGGLQRIEIA